MMQRIKTTSFYLLIGCFLTASSYFLDSCFLKKFLLEDFLTVLITLLAINLATIGIVFSKLEEIAGKVEEKTNKRPSFKKTKQEVQLSIQEQFVMILLTILSLMVYTSKYSEEYIYLKYGAEVLLNTVLTWALCVLYDTSSSVFVVLNAETPNPHK